MATALAAGDSEQAELDREHQNTQGGKTLVAALKLSSTKKKYINNIMDQTDGIDYGLHTISELISILIEKAKKLESHDGVSLTRFVKKELHLKKRGDAIDLVIPGVIEFYNGQRKQLLQLPFLERELLNNGSINQFELDSIKHLGSVEKLEYLLNARYMFNYLKSFPNENSL